MTYTKEEVEDIVSKLINEMFADVNFRESNNRAKSVEHATEYARSKGKNKEALKKYEVHAYAAEELFSVKVSIENVITLHFDEYMKKDEA